MFELTRRNTNHPVGCYNPFRGMDEFEKNFFGFPFGGFFDGRELAEFRTDITDEGDHYMLEADLPGFDKKDINLSIDGDSLTVKAERHSKFEDKDSKDTALMIERQRAIAKNILEKYDVKVVKVEKLDEMNDAEIRGAEAYFDDRFDCSVTAVQGYEYHVQVEVRYSKDDDDTNRTDSAICVVKLKDDGWKVIPDSAGNLSYYEKSTK